MHALIALALLAAAPAFAADPVADGAFRDAQMALASRTALSLARSAGRLSADTGRRGAFDDRAAAVRLLDAAEAADAAARAAGRPGDPARLAAARAALARLTPLPDAGLAPLGLAQAQALLARDEALLLIQPTRDGTYLFAVTADRVDWRRSATDAAAIATRVTQLRRALDPGGVARSGEDAAPQARTAIGFPRASAHTLYTAIWAPVAATLAPARIVYVVAGGALGALPLGLLPATPPRGRDGDPTALRRTDWLIRRHAIVTLPSIASLAALRRVPLRASGGGFAGFGAPLANPRAPGLPPLPGTARELDSLRGTVGSGIVLTGAAATERAIAAAPLDRAAVIAFATHGLVAGEAGAGAEPALLLSPPAPGEPGDGLLSASEAAALSLDADWVILSACNTAAGDPAAGGEGLSGLARGFFAAGARAVLASHWRVRDDAAEALTVATIRRWRARPAEGRAQALRTAMLAMITDRAHPERADPAWWAPLVVAGEGR